VDAPRDRYPASRAELIALMVRQREQRADVAQAQAQAQARLRPELTTRRAALDQFQTRVGRVLAALDPAAR
jgi:hypothetical protein